MSVVTERDKLTAQQNKTLVTIVSIFFPPLGYVFVRRWGLAILCLLTFGWFFLGVLLVPLHVRRIIGASRQRVTESP